ncbi:uncharacterized protein LOC115187341 [Salmo trutta]|uniref:uncharacterized protein LOC115187341 n=1 Tax=Salmo trutta TaxID=8032 RepID=UPI001132346D|nr:uncharacterized protein LOC115187341 [Salmo trutta]
MGFREKDHELKTFHSIEPIAAPMSFHAKDLIYNRLPGYNVVWNPSNNSYDLLIENITESDLGLYYCGTVENKVVDDGDCGLCWMLLFSLCPVSALLSSLLSSTCVYSFCRTTAPAETQLPLNRTTTRGSGSREETAVKEEGDLCYASLDIRQGQRRPKKKKRVQNSDFSTYSAINTSRISRLKASVHQSLTVSSTKLIECSTKSFSPESVRLVDGAGLCSGRVEVKSDQSWASVCEADFDRQDAEVVCGELGCGAPAALQGGLYGGGEGQTWDKEFQCKGKESLLLDCDTSDREKNTCLPGNAVGLTCSEPDDVRLVGGGSRCAGGVERYDQGEWRTVGDDYWGDVAVVVCRQLGCGSTVSVLPGNTTRGFGASCSGSEPSLRECWRRFKLFPGLTVICSDLLVQPDIFLTDSMGGVSRGHQGPEMFRGYNFTITCSTQPQYPGGSFLLTFTGSNRTQTQPAVNHSAAFLFPAADDSHQGNYSCVYDNYVFSHNFSSESELLSLTITASPLPAFIIRHVVVLLILLTAITTSYLYYKPTRRQKRVNRVSSMDLYVNAMEMVSLSSRAEAGPGEERAAQGTE